MDSPDLPPAPGNDPLVFKFSCSHCGQRISYASDLTGETVDCPACKRSFLVSLDPTPFETLPKASNPHRPRAFGGKGAEGVKKGFPISNHRRDRGVRHGARRLAARPALERESTVRKTLR
jgi:hypothetical protein